MNHLKHISSPEMYKTYYLNQVQQKGGGSEYFTGHLFQKGYGQRGRGIGNVLGRLFRRVLPFLSNASKHVGKLALHTGANVLSDTASGKDFQSSLKTRLKESGNHLKQNTIKEAQNAIAEQIGSGRKRKRKGTLRNVKQKKSKPSKSRSIKGSTTKKSTRTRKSTKLRTFKDIFGSSR